MALFVLLGTTYGGDGVNTFGLPDLRGRVPVHMGPASSGTFYKQGAAGGSESVTLNVTQVPAHTHGVNADGNPGTVAVTTSSYFAAPASQVVTPPPMYAPASMGPLQTLAPEAVEPAGGGAAHDNRQPYIAMNYCIAVQGLFPPRQ